MDMLGLGVEAVSEWVALCVLKHWREQLEM